MNGEINNSFIYNGQPQNGATAKLWQITGFAAYVDSGETVQDNPFEAASIELNCSDGSVFAVGDIIKIENELLRIWDINTDLLYVIRGYRGTGIAQHVQTTAIYDETITEPGQDDAEPTAGYQQGASITTDVNYGGDGAYRWTAVPEGEYYISLYYDAHRAWLYDSVETNDPTPSQIVTTDGDVIIRNADGVARLGKGALNQLLTMDANRPTWQDPVIAGKFLEIGDTTLGAPAASISFAGIAAGYAMFLVLFDNLYTDQAALRGLLLNFNADGGANYDYNLTLFKDVAAHNLGQTAIKFPDFGNTAGQQMRLAGRCFIFNRATYQKTVEAITTEWNAGGVDINKCVDQHLRAKWRNVANEISTITFSLDAAGNFVAGSRIILLGVST